VKTVTHLFVVTTECLQFGIGTAILFVSTWVSLNSFTKHITGLVGLLSSYIYLGPLELNITHGI
jgi:hypothetical protein